MNLYERVQLIEDKFLFKLDMLNNHISVIEYINDVISYEKSNSCHINNIEFHKNSIMKHKIVEKDYNGKVNTFK